LFLVLVWLRLAGRDRGGAGRAEIYWLLLGLGWYFFGTRPAKGQENVNEICLDFH
jgi:hypothetical protein